jgi:hypothetical protein
MDEEVIYNRPPLNNHEVLYKGKRYWLFKLNKDFIYRGSKYESVLGSGEKTVILFDCLDYEINTEGVINENGSITTEISYGQNSVACIGNNAREFVKNTVSVIDWIKHEDVKTRRKEFRKELIKNKITQISGFELKLWKRLGFKFDIYRTHDGRYSFDAKKKMGNVILNLRSSQSIPNACLAKIVYLPLRQKQNHVLTQKETIDWFSEQSIIFKQLILSKRI